MFLEFLSSCRNHIYNTVYIFVSALEALYSHVITFPWTEDELDWLSLLDESVVQANESKKKPETMETVFCSQL